MATKATGIRIRHARGCPASNGRDCCGTRGGCKPSYVAWVWSPSDGKKIYRTFGKVSEARNWRSDAGSAARKGVMKAPVRKTVREAADEWIAKARAGEILKPDGQRYKPSVLRTYEGDLARYVLPAIGSMQLARLQRRDVQALVDALTGRLARTDADMARRRLLHACATGVNRARRPASPARGDRLGER